MTDQSPSTSNPPAWLVDWIREAGSHTQWHSLVLGAKCGTDLHRISCHVANYLNEFDDEAGCQWRAFDIEEVRHLAGDPISRDLILSSTESSSAPPDHSDLDRIARRLARLGGVILEGQCGFEATSDLSEAFHVCLCLEDPRPRESYHMWINPNRFSRDSLVNIIADSFLNWTSQHRSRSRRRSHDAPGKSGGGEPPSPEFTI